MRVGIICSAGGSAALAAADICPHVTFRFVTDRPCGVEPGCQQRNLECVRVPWEGQQAFSAAAHRVLSGGGGCDLIVMFYARLVGAPLVGELPLLNVHPSLLPAFPGLNAVGQAKAAGVRFLGATLHVADATMDGGPIVAQACAPLPLEWDAAMGQHLSFLQKTALLLVGIEMQERGWLSWEGARATVRPGWSLGDRLNPMLVTPRYLSGLRALQQQGQEFL